MRNSSSELRVGLFALLALGLIVFATIKVGGGSIGWNSGYTIQVTLDSATGISTKTPVEIAGIQVGEVSEVALAADGRRARASLRITRDDVRLPQGTSALVRAKGFLGDTYIELVPGSQSEALLSDGDELAFSGSGGDINMMITEFSDIARDVRAITKSARGMIGDENAPVQKMVQNMTSLVETMKRMVDRNEQHVNAMAENFAELSETLRYAVAPDVENSMSRVASITRKIDEGSGTVGKLINDPSTADKLESAIDSFNDALGGFSRMQTEIGYHSEYLGESKDFKHYVHLNLRPRPDEAFLFEFVEDRTPSPNIVNTTSTVTAGASTSTIQTQTQTVDENQFRLSAQLAKTFHDLTLRGGLIESRGGVGVDYEKGPVRLSASAFDFNTDNGAKPHLKFWGQLNVTPSIHVLGGIDDPLNPNQSTDWFVGAGISLIDEDLKSLLSGVGLSSALSK